MMKSCNLPCRSDKHHQHRCKRGHTKTSSACDEATVHKLADDLRTDSSAKTILERLKVLSVAVEDPRRAAELALVFLRAGGLPTLIHLLDPPATSPLTSDADVTPSALPDGTPSAIPDCTPCATPDVGPSAIPDEAARALNALLDSDDIKAQLRLATGVVAPLAAAFRNASLLTRYTAVRALKFLAEAQPAQCKPMLEAGMMGLLLAFYIDVGNSLEHTDLLLPVVDLTILLVNSDSEAARQLKRAILGEHLALTFAALVLLQVWNSRPCTRFV
jgi:hypothetical protein